MDSNSNLDDMLKQIKEVLDLEKNQEVKMQNNKNQEQLNNNYQEKYHYKNLIFESVDKYVESKINSKEIVDEMLKIVDKKLEQKLMDIVYDLYKDQLKMTIIEKISNHEKINQVMEKTIGDVIISGKLNSIISSAVEKTIGNKFFSYE